MKSRTVSTGQNLTASQHDDIRDDARGGSFLLPHQQLGALALGTTPTNGQVVDVIVNGTTIPFTAVTGTPTNPGEVKAPGTAAGFVANLMAGLRRPDLTTSTFVALSSANQVLVQYLGWANPGGGTTIVPFSLNKNINGSTDILTSFNITTTVTSGTWTAHTMQLYIEDGVYYIGNTRVLFTGGSTPTFTAPSSHPRIDIVTADSSGTLAITQGTENVSPVAPTYPANKLVICEVYNVVGETAICDFEDQQGGQGYIYNDVRPIAAAIYIASASQVASGLFIPDPGSEAQGDILYYGNSGWALLTPGSSGQVLETQGASANPQWSSIAALGGNCAIGTLSISGTGNVSVSGLSFTPSFVLFFVNWSGSSGSVEWSGQSSGSMTASQQGASWSAHTVASGTNVNGAGTTFCIAAFNNSSLSQTLAASFVSFNSTGFTVNATTASVAQTVMYVAFK